ncbi:MAG: hypothetical protein ABSG03_06100 [Bryobacteraceae bacterium]
MHVSTSIFDTAPVPLASVTGASFLADRLFGEPADTATTGASPALTFARLPAVLLLHRAAA